MFVLLEGLDVTGKSTVAEIYREKGFEVVHLSAPDKKYYQKNYVGPSYLDEIVELYLKYTGKNVVYDRTPLGEVIWPHIYNRQPLLNEEDFEVLREIEQQNDAEYILMYDQDVAAHWKRCVETKQPLDMVQFKQAVVMFDSLVNKYGFKKMQLTDFTSKKNTESNSTKEAIESNKIVVNKEVTKVSLADSKSTEQLKLEKANAINRVLSCKRILKQGEEYDDLEKDTRVFLQSKLSEILNGSNNNQNLTADEVAILKLYCSRIKEKMEAK
jgi:hypothetical protein